jgi:virulence factor Mce-like protein
MSRRGSASIAANPVLIGAATTLVVLVAVFLAYNANSGLPFVPTYGLKAQVPSAANLVPGNEVRLGGVRVGVVDKIDPIRRANGDVDAQLTLQLDTAIRPLPVDSTILIRPRSALGLKYVEITKGKSGKGFEDGATVPVSAATPQPVEFDDFLSTFDEPTRQAQRRNLVEVGGALTGRGQDLNTAIGDLRPLLQNLVPVMRNLSAPETRLARLFQALNRSAGIVAPAAETQAQLFANLDTTFTALGRVARPYVQDAITNGPPALDEAIRDFPVQRPFLRNTEQFVRELRPGVRALSNAAPDLSDALRTGTPALRRSLQLSARLEPTFAALQRFAQDPLVVLGVQGVTNLADILRPTVAHLKPLQTVCNYGTLWFRNVSSLLSEGDKNGTGQRFTIIATPQGPNNEGGPSSAPANGPNKDNYLHANPYPNTAAPGQTLECEAANETYLAGQKVIGNVPGNQGTGVDRTTPDKTTNQAGG